MKYIIQVFRQFLDPSYKIIEINKQSSVRHFEESLKSIKNSLEQEPFIPWFIQDIYIKKDLREVKNLIDDDFWGGRLLVYLAILQEYRCLETNGNINWAQIINTVNFFLKEVKSQESLDYPNGYAEAERRIQKFLTELEKRDEKLLCAIRDIRLQWLEGGRSSLIFDGTGILQEQIGKLAGEILDSPLADRVRSFSEMERLRRAAVNKSENWLKIRKITILTNEILSNRGLVWEHIKIRRVIAVAPGVGEVIYKLGAAKKLVGAAILKKENFYSNDVEQVAQNGMINHSLIESLNPDLIFCDAKQTKELLSYMKGAHSRIIYEVSPTQRTDEIESLVIDIAKLLGMSKNREFVEGVSKGIKAQYRKSSLKSGFVLDMI